jgi:hypothetical protein
VNALGIVSPTLYVMTGSKYCHNVDAFSYAEDLRCQYQNRNSLGQTSGRLNSAMESNWEIRHSAPKCCEILHLILLYHRKSLYSLMREAMDNVILVAERKGFIYVVL